MSDIFLGFYLGVFTVILLFNLLWYIYNKEKAFLYYFFMHLSIVFLALDVYNVFNTSLILTAIATIFFSLLFTKEFLNLEYYYKNISKYFQYFTIVFSCFLLILFISDSKEILKNIPFSILFLALVILGYKIYKKGFILAKYFVIAWGVNTIIILLVDINRIFNIDILSIKYLSQIGNILEALILSFALFAKTKILNDEKNEKEKMLIHQSRLASMGEMLANISHQWRQPLNRIASFIMNMQMHIMDNYEKEKYLLEKLEESQAQLEYMSSTIDDFTNFYQKDKTKEKFLVSQAITNAITIIDSSIKAKKIELILEIKDDFELNSYPKELSQVILNLLQNSKDALVLNRIAKPFIKIEVYNKTIIVSDNANGIDPKIINQIFDPYFTTKEKHKGTGLGLYMSKMILEKNMNATIEVTNNNNGSEFTLIFT